MAPKGSINADLLEEFVDCRVRLTVRGQRAEGYLHSVARLDSGLQLAVGPAVPDRRSGLMSYDEAQIDEIQGETVNGWAKLFPEDADAIDESADAPESEPLKQEEPEEKADGTSFEPSGPGQPMTSDLTNMEQQEAEKTHHRRKRGTK